MAALIIKIGFDERTQDGIDGLDIAIDCSLKFLLVCFECLATAADRL